MNEQLYCLRRDQQRSFTGLLDQDGKFVVEYSFDAWGNRRNPGNWQLPDSRTSFAISRGYTGQEHLDVFGLINMNGRMYDPQIGRFLSPDIVNQAPDFSQSYNRYSYCLNNPLNMVDLNGYEYDDNYEDWGDDYGDRDDDNVELYHHPILIPRDKEEFDEVRFYEFIDEYEGACDPLEEQIEACGDGDPPHGEPIGSKQNNFPVVSVKDEYQIFCNLLLRMEYYVSTATPETAKIGLIADKNGIPVGASIKLSEGITVTISNQGTRMIKGYGIILGLDSRNNFLFGSYVSMGKSHVGQVTAISNDRLKEVWTGISNTLFFSIPTEILVLMLIAL